MKLKEVLKILIDRFQKEDIDFVLSGGLALSTMGIFRFTKDKGFFKLKAMKLIWNLLESISNYSAKGIY